MSIASSLTVSTVNVNGVRAAAKKGMLAWLHSSEADVVCLQETRADDEQLAKALAPVLDEGWHLSAACSAVKGRNGVAVLTRTAPAAVRVGFGDDEFAEAGRYIEVDIAYSGGPLTVASLYLPSGDVGTPRQDEKDRFLKSFGDYLGSIANRPQIICGDFNIAHAEADIKNWRGNLKSSGFLPHEREWLSGLIGDGQAWADVIRVLNPGVEGPYTWWSYRGKAFDNDAGWRIDYHITSRVLAGRASGARVERAPTYDARWSDHAPVTVRYA
ncbi:exodeoxyribonuclease III [Hoyosella subflava]|uniref:Exodeoxyribonuclease n=1 Tax=Hoyosella subflava (strain DSM 45089 / JCM 17490 / NBRC 109087 / DQS3-9A1) TaxID=443218 RepID=F6EIC7_HOYSD|nr:exodeoxyribonuclease III [Hoyosella subflava]AEF42419.1 Exodeoxyribonuclease [Hoyosella subflava DQS3-9A1]